MNYQLAGTPQWERQRRINWMLGFLVAFLATMVALMYLRLNEWKKETEANSIYNQRTTEAYASALNEYKEMVRLHKQRDSLEIIKLKK